MPFGWCLSENFHCIISNFFVLTRGLSAVIAVSLADTAKRWRWTIKPGNEALTFHGPTGTSHITFSLIRGFAWRWWRRRHLNDAVQEAVDVDSSEAIPQLDSTAALLHLAQ